MMILEKCENNGVSAKIASAHWYSQQEYERLEKYYQSIDLVDIYRILSPHKQTNKNKNKRIAFFSSAQRHLPK